MTDNLFKLYTTQFSSNMELLLQQLGSKLRGLITEGYHVGKQASPINQLAAVSLRQPSGKFSPIGRVDTDFVRRWVMPQDGDLPLMIDSFDELRTIVDPKSKYVEATSSAVGRAWDDAIIAAATGTSKIGTDPGAMSDESFPGAPYLVADNFGTGSGSAVGLTIPKLIEARRIFRHYHVDLERDPVTLVIGSQQEADLMSNVQVVSTEFNDRPVLVDGRLTRFLGFNIVVSERLGMAADGLDRACFAFAKSGMYLGIWRDLTSRVTIRNDLTGHPYQLYTMVTFGATRTQLGKVVQIDCLDSTGIDITP